MQELPNEIWVGYENSARQFIEKQALQVDACEQMQCLRARWEGLSTRRRRLFSKWVLCQRPVVHIGIVGSVSPCVPVRTVLDGGYLLRHTQSSFSDAAKADYPRETQCRSLRKSDLLTRAFTNPHSLVDEADYFVQDRRFHVRGNDGLKLPARVRHVVFVAHETDRRMLLYPLVLAVWTTAASSAIVALLTRDLATGAQVGGTIGGSVTLVLAFAMWRLS